jgi:hypothetical protein
MPRIERPPIGADRVIVTAMLKAFLPALVAVTAEALQFAAPKLDRIVVVRHDVIGNARGGDVAFAQAPLAQRLRAQLSACASVPKRFVVKLTHPLSRFAMPRTHERADRSRLGAYFAVTSPPVLSNWYFCLRLSKKMQRDRGNPVVHVRLPLRHSVGRAGTVMKRTLHRWRKAPPEAQPAHETGEPGQTRSGSDQNSRLRRLVTDAELEIRFPSVPWRDPIRISDFDGDFGFACRFCIARHGIGCDIPSLSMSAREVRRHIGEHHPGSVGHTRIRRSVISVTLARRGYDVFSLTTRSSHAPSGRRATAVRPKKRRPVQKKRR